MYPTAQTYRIENGNLELSFDFSGYDKPFEFIKMFERVKFSRKTVFLCNWSAGIYTTYAKLNTVLFDGFIVTVKCNILDSFAGKIMSALEGSTHLQFVLWYDLKTFEYDNIDCKTW
jgi:hypothetical protein